jgi:hypothetical protein
MLKHLFSTALDHGGLNYFRGLDEVSDCIYVEQIYGDEDWLAQYCLDASGQIVGRFDEADNTGKRSRLLDIPQRLAAPAPLSDREQVAIPLVRLQGDRAAERIDDLMYPLTMAEKLWLGTQSGVPAPLILGIGGRELVAQARLPHSGEMVVCVKSWITQALTEARYDPLDGRCTYASIVVYSLHEFDADGEIHMDQGITALGGIDFKQPMDLLATADRLFMVDGNWAGGAGYVHGWRYAEEPSSSVR